MKKTIVVTPSIRSRESVLGAEIQNAVKIVEDLLKYSIKVVAPPTSLPGIPYVDQLRKHIENADMLIADLSSTWPSVLVEVGFAEALRKPVLLLAQDSAQVPAPSFDRRVILYSEPSSPHVVPRLQEALLDTLSTVPQVGGSEHGRGATRIFISYSHEDKEYLDRILVHLRPLEREHLIDPWSDNKIKTGDNWREEITNALKVARAAVLLVSADFLASEFISTNELPELLAGAAKKRGTRIIPIILKPSRFQRDTSLSKFKALNIPELPVIKMTEAEREELYEKLAAEIEMDLGFGAKG